MRVNDVSDLNNCCRHAIYVWDGSRGFFQTSNPLYVPLLHYMIHSIIHKWNESVISLELFVMLPLIFTDMLCWTSEYVLEHTKFCIWALTFKKPRLCTSDDRKFPESGFHLILFINCPAFPKNMVQSTSSTVSLRWYMYQFNVVSVGKQHLMLLHHIHTPFSLAHLRLIIMLKREETQHLCKCKWCFWPCCSSLLQLCTWGPFQGPATTVTFSSLTRSSSSRLILPTKLPSLSIDLNTLVTIQSFQWLMPRSKKFYVSSLQTYVLDPPRS